jgi:hypothetical protein
MCPAVGGRPYLRRVEASSNPCQPCKSVLSTGGGPYATQNIRAEQIVFERIGDRATTAQHIGVKLG